MPPSQSPVSVCALDIDPTRLVFIDETGASTNMARTRGRSRRGRRLRAAISHGHYKTVTLVAGLRLRGLVAQKAFDRPINAAAFEEWVENCLVPTLPKGDIVVMDNLSSHKGPRVEQLIKAAEAELRYLPLCSPDMNPIALSVHPRATAAASSPLGERFAKEGPRRKVPHKAPEGGIQEQLGVSCQTLQVEILELDERLTLKPSSAGSGLNGNPGSNLGGKRHPHAQGRTKPSLCSWIPSCRIGA